MPRRSLSKQTRQSNTRRSNARGRSNLEVTRQFGRAGEVGQGVFSMRQISCRALCAERLSVRSGKNWAGVLLRVKTFHDPETGFDFADYIAEINFGRWPRQFRSAIAAFDALNKSMFVERLDDAHQMIA